MKLILATASAALAVAGAASAATETFSYTVDQSTVPFTQDFTLSGFNTALGTLTGVTLTLDDSTTAEVQIVSLNSTATPYTDATATIPVTVTGPDGLTVDATVTAGPVAGTAEPGLNTVPGVPGSDTDSTNVSSSDFSLYESPGGVPVAYTFDALAGSYTGTSAGGLFFGGSAVAGGDISVTYTYTSAVPEAATWALMLVGIGAVGGTMRRRSATLAV
jgi:hypothetical protein